jgi:hypothetical protein
VRPDSLLQDGLMLPAAAAVLGTPYAFDLYLWHGLTLALGLSLVTVLLGAGSSAPGRACTRRWCALRRVRGGPVAGYFGALRAS